jgi:hypothetical protein
MRPGAADRFRRDLAVAGLGFLVIFSVAFVVGRALVPAGPLALGEISAPPEGSSDGGVLSLADLHAELAGDAFGSIAVLQASGAIEGTFRLGLNYREWMEHGVLEGPALDLNMSYVSYQSGFDEFGGGGEGADGVVDQDLDSTFTLTAPGLEVGTERTERYTIILLAAGKMYSAQDGQCVLELLELDFTTVPPFFGNIGDDRIMPVFLGQVTCEDVKELRSDDTVSFTAVFHYDSEDF